MRRFRAEQAELEAEIQVRERIFSEIHNRMRWQLRNGTGGSRRVPAEADMLTGAWSRLSYNFSGATFFYPVDFSESAERSEERRVGKECRSRWSPYH